MNGLYRPIRPTFTADHVALALVFAITLAPLFRNHNHIPHLGSQREFRNGYQQFNSQLFEVFIVSATDFYHDSAIRAGLVRSTTTFINRAKAVSVTRASASLLLISACVLSLMPSTPTTFTYQPGHGAREQLSRATGIRLSTAPGLDHNSRQSQKRLGTWGLPSMQFICLQCISFEGRNYSFVIDSISRVG
ncbi:hypothetical protein LA080_009241 [Diaporthe eres]|nr:hypothetical protein LA080_009241 [Diaporthe eres]